MRLINPTENDIRDAVYGASLLADVQVPRNDRLAYTQTGPNTTEIAKTATHKAAGFLDTTGELLGSGPTVAAVVVAWYTRLNGVKVVRIDFGPATVKDGALPGLVNPAYVEQLVANGGYPVLASERLASVFGLIVKYQNAEKHPNAADAVMDAPGDLNVWKDAADAFYAHGSHELAKNIRQAIGA